MNRQSQPVEISPTIRFRLLPENTSMAGPVFINPPNRMRPPMVSWKIIFPDGSETVVAASCRLLWAGADGMAYDKPTGSFWSPVASKNPAGIILGGRAA